MFFIIFFYLFHFAVMATKYFEKYFKYKSTGRQAYLTLVDCNRLTPLP